MLTYRVVWNIIGVRSLKSVTKALNIAFKHCSVPDIFQFPKNIVYYTGHVSGWGPAEEPAALHWVSAEPWSSVLSRSRPPAPQGYVRSHAKLSRRVPKHPSTQCHPGSPQHHHTHTRSAHRWVKVWPDLSGHGGVDHYRSQWWQELCILLIYYKSRLTY